MRTIRSAILVTLALGVGGPALAQDAPEADGAGPPAVIREGDASLTCVQLGEEAAQLSETMGGSPSGGLFGAVGSVARSGAAALIPGAGLVMKGVDVLAKPARDRREAETLAVEHRWYYLNGLYAGQGCREQAEAATPAPAQAPSAAVTAPTATPAAAAAPAPPRVTPVPIATPAAAAPQSPSAVD